MSIKAINHVWEYSKQRGSSLVLLLAIADMANDDGDCYPGIARLADKCNIKERQLQALLRHLEAEKIIAIFNQEGIETAHGKTNYYRYLWKSEKDGVQKSAPLGVQKSAPKPPVDPVGAKKKRPTQRKDGGPVVSVELMTPMKNQIAEVFGWSWDRMTPEEIGIVQKAARSLCLAGVTPGYVPELHAYCAKRYETFGPMALATNVSKWRSQRGIAPDDTVPAVLATTTPQQRALDSMYRKAEGQPS